MKTESYGELFLPKSFFVKLSKSDFWFAFFINLFKEKSNWCC